MATHASASSVSAVIVTSDNKLSQHDNASLRAQPSHPPFFHWQCGDSVVPPSAELRSQRGETALSQRAVKRRRRSTEAEEPAGRSHGARRRGHGGPAMGGNPARRDSRERGRRPGPRCSNEAPAARCAGRRRPKRGEPRAGRPAGTALCAGPRAARCAHTADPRRPRRGKAEPSRDPGRGPGGRREQAQGSSQIGTWRTKSVQRLGVMTNGSGSVDAPKRKSRSRRRRQQLCSILFGNMSLTRHL